METDSCHGIEGCLNRRCRLERHKRYAREGWLNDWSHIMWTTRQAPEWQPRRASVATCQQQLTQNRHGQYEVMHRFGELTNSSSSIRDINRDYQYQRQQLSKQRPQQQQQSNQNKQVIAKLDASNVASTTSTASMTSTYHKSCIRVSRRDDDDENCTNRVIRKDPNDDESSSSICGTSLDGTNILLEDLDQGERGKRDDDGGGEARNEAIVELTKAAVVPQRNDNQSRQLSAIKTTRGGNMSTTSSGTIITTTTTTVSAGVSKRKNRFVSKNKDSDGIANRPTNHETEANQRAQLTKLRQDEEEEGREDNTSEKTTSRPTVVSSKQPSRPTLELCLGCRNSRRRATAPSATTTTTTTTLLVEATCCPKSTATTTLDGLALAAPTTASTKTTTTVPPAATAASAVRNFNDDEEILNGSCVAVSERLQLQDKQRKCLIFSMALKQIIAGRRFDLSTAKSIMATPGQDCCYGSCRSRSCSFNVINSGGVGGGSGVGSGDYGSGGGGSATMKADQQQQQAVSNDFRTVLSSSRSALIDKLQTGRATAGTANSIMETQLKISNDEEKNSKLQRKPESINTNCDTATLTATPTTYPDQQRSRNKSRAALNYQHSSIELSFPSVNDTSRSAIEEFDQKMNAMRRLIVGKDEFTCDNSGQQRGGGWCDHSNDSPSADSCELENDTDEEEILDSPTMTGNDGGRLEASDSDSAWNNNNNDDHHTHSDSHFDDTFINRRLPDITSRRSHSVQSKSSAISDDLIALETDDLNLEVLIVESWLDDHPSFFYEYFMRKASHQMIDDWLSAHAKVSSNTNLNSHRLNFNSSQQSLNTPARGSLRRADIDTAAPNSSKPKSAEIDGGGQGHFASSGRPMRSNSQSSAGGYYQEAMTPVRKISATDFESRTGSGLLRPLLSTTPDGRLTFLSQPSPTVHDNTIINPTSSLKKLQQQSEANGSRRHSCTSESKEASAAMPLTNTASPTKSTTSRSNSDQSAATAAAYGDAIETHKFNELYDNQADDDELPPCDGEVKLIFELVKNICNDLDIRTLLHKILRNISVLINADKSSLFLVYGEPNDPNRHLVSQLFNVDQDSSECNETEDCIKIPWGTGLVGYVAESGESVNIANCYEDPRFTNSIDQKTGYVTKHMLCAPIFDNRNDIVGVAQVINKRDGNPFSRSDEIKFKRYLQFCGIGLRNAQSYENCQLENRRNQVLLDLARMVFEEQSTIEQVVYRIMLHTQSLLECQRCQVLLIDDGSEDLDQLLKQPNPSASSDGAPCDENNCSTNDNNNMTSSVVVDPPEWKPQCHQVVAATAAPDEAKVRVRNKPIDGENVMPDFSTDGEDGENSRIIDSTASTQKKLFSLVFDLECDGNDPVMHSTKGGDIVSIDSSLPIKNHKFPINIGITGYVAMTGETLNIEDAHSHERFDPSVDDDSDFKHKSILCMPIRNGKRQIIGVSQLINKKNGKAFNKNDENLFEAFSIFCGLGIHNTLMYERVLKIMAKQKVTFEVLSYHATAPLEEAKRLSMEQIPSCFALDLGSLKFNDFSLNEQYMLKSCLRFFLDLDLMRRFQIDQLVFCNWILSVQKNYRKVTYHPIVGGTGLKASPVRYHNWRHAFNVSQMMFAILVNTQICRALGELETLALLIACLCHDLDHRGTNNSFQIKSASPLAELYSTSTMEHHHFDQCVMILNSQGNQILANLSPAEYSKVIMLLEEAILATDLANYFKQRDTFFQLVNGNKFNWQRDPKHRSLLRCMLMTACDVAAITKPWPIQKVVADLVMSEFYQQGDIERNELNIEPIDMMNRDKMSKLPEMQIGFIDSICAPIYTAFAKLFPRELGPLMDGCLANRTLWTEMANNNVQMTTNSPNIGFLTNNLELCARQTSLTPKNISKSETHLCYRQRSTEELSRANMPQEKTDEVEEIHFVCNKPKFRAVSNQDKVGLRFVEGILDSTCQRKSI